MCNFLVSTFFFLTWSTGKICISSLVRNLFLKIFRTCNRAWIFKVLLCNKISMTRGWAEVLSNADDGQILNRWAWSELYSPSHISSEGQWMNGSFLLTNSFQPSVCETQTRMKQRRGGDLRSGWGKRISGCIHLRRTTKEDPTRGQTNWTKEMFFKIWNF
jgi:hypothetical protein